MMKLLLVALSSLLWLRMILLWDVFGLILVRRFIVSRLFWDVLLLFCLRGCRFWWSFSIVRRWSFIIW